MQSAIHHGLHEKRLARPADFGGKALPIPVVELKELITLAIGQDGLDLVEIAFEAVFEQHALSAYNGDHA